MDHSHPFQKVADKKRKIEAHKVCGNSVSYRSHNGTEQFDHYSGLLMGTRQAFLPVTYLLYFILNSLYKFLQIINTRAYDTMAYLETLNELIKWKY